MPLTAEQALALRLHRQLDQTLATGGVRRFVSGYDTTHPFVRAYLGDANGTEPFDHEAGPYTFAQDQRDLIGAIQTFHQLTDGVHYEPREILLSAGSSPLILSILSWLSEEQQSEIYYFKPLYHAFYFWADILKLRLIPLSEEPLWDDRGGLSLPDRRSVLLITDPVWFAGRTLGPATIDALQGWQARTGSVVVVDGTFQYLQWAWPERCERTSTLLRERTIRLVCPTKSLALHGIRFAYLLGPADVLGPMRWICDGVTGSASVVDLRLAGRLMHVLALPEGNRQLTDYIRDRYSALIDTGFIRDPVREPECGYYVFGTLDRPVQGDLVMGGEYFEIAGHGECVRINVLSPGIEA